MLPGSGGQRLREGVRRQSPRALDRAGYVLLSHDFEWLDVVAARRGSTASLGFADYDVAPRYHRSAAWYSIARPLAKQRRYHVVVRHCK